MAFDSVGMPYDVVEVSPSTVLSLETLGVGKYSGIVSIQKSLLSTSQQSQIIAYQKQVSSFLLLTSYYIFIFLSPY